MLSPSRMRSRVPPSRSLFKSVAKAILSSTSHSIGCIRFPIMLVIDVEHRRLQIAYWFLLCIDWIDGAARGVHAESKVLVSVGMFVASVLVSNSQNEEVTSVVEKIVVKYPVPSRSSVQRTPLEMWIRATTVENTIGRSIVSVLTIVLQEEISKMQCY